MRSMTLNLTEVAAAIHYEFEPFMLLCQCTTIPLVRRNHRVLN
jgi:hypothetical protein